MYITYVQKQHEIISLDGSVARPEMTQQVSNQGPSFKPSWLVRVSDFELIQGDSLNEPYWALSYSWNQSGKIIKTGDEEYDRIDEGKHTIVSNKKRFWGAPRRRHVNFEGLIQQICMDFGIKYIWYDQRCINQSNHDEKISEIKKMHLIYRNALCTLALIPELELPAGADPKVDVDAILNSEWSKRMWTLEEAYMSQCLLFVGHNTHMWSDIGEASISGPTVSSDYFLSNICNGTIEWNASTALWYARTRTSSNSHDTIFALVNMFPSLKSEITFDYKQPLLTLMYQFYSLLAQKDLSILLFGAPIDPKLNEQKVIRRNEHKMLPSWVGISGVHIPQNPSAERFVRTNEGNWIVRPEKASGYMRSGFSSYTVTEGSLYITFCACISVSIENSNSIKKVDDMNEYSFFHTKDGLPCYPLNSLYEPRQILTPGHRRYLTFITTTPESQEDHNNQTKSYELKATHYLPVKKETENWINSQTRPTAVAGCLSLTEECAECLILSDITFNNFDGQRSIAMPVVKKINGSSSYKAIGVCITEFELCSAAVTQIKHLLVIE